MFLRKLIFSVIFLSAVVTPSVSAIKIQRYLASLRLGDSLKQIEQIYPPSRNWPQHKEPGGKLDRIRIERGYSKWFPPGVRTVSLGMRRGKLVRLKLIYNKVQSREKALGELVLDLSLIYGEPRRYREKYFWWDAKTVLAVYDTPIKTLKGLELRTSLELMEKGYFEPFRD